VSVPGVDVAAFQHPGGATIPWASWYAAGFRIAYVQATQGTGIHNAYFAQDVRDARAAGFRVGAYHLCYPALNPNPASEWAYFSAAVAGVTLDLPPMLDDEEIGGLSWVELRTWVLGWLALAGPSALHYSNQSYLANLTAAGGIPYRQWTARPGATALAAGDIATQYGAGPIAGSQSVDQDYFDPTILPAPPDPPQGEASMLLITATVDTEGTQALYYQDGLLYYHIQEADGSAFEGLPATVNRITLSLAGHQAMLAATTPPPSASPASVQAVQTAVEALPVPAGPAALAAVGSGVAALQAAVAKIPTTDPPASGSGKVALTFSGTYKGGKTSGTATGTVS
jgi:hypothetical protein